MRINVHLRNQGFIHLPLHYNEVLQAFIYRHMEPALSEWVHDTGWLDGKRRLKLFTFSRPWGLFTRRQEGLYFQGRLSFAVASPVEAILQSFAQALVRADVLYLARAQVELSAIEVAIQPSYRRPVLLKALSPITVYSTLETPDGRKKTYYYTPQEPEFGRLVIENLRRKIRAWTGEDVPPEGATLRPVKVSNRNLVVARYKGTIIKGWTGIYELDAPEPYFHMALDAGLGAKNSQGFGFVEVWEPREKSITRRHGDHRE